MWQTRTKLLLGDERVNRMGDMHILIVGVGGVGAYAAEMLCRAGIGTLTIVDGDTVNESNLNRQLVALRSTIGQYKTEVLAKRLLDINPNLKITVFTEFLKDERIPQLLDSGHFDYVVDAIDTLSPKVFLIQNVIERGMKIISSMGAGAKTDPLQIKIADISKSYNCNLAKAVRKRLGKIGIKKGFPVVFSSELADEKAIIPCTDEQNKVSTVGTVSYMPPTFGNFIASYIIREC
ncbi:MAG: tRNA threonylcarbamoyladenosine dehydratase [Paludibacteraceae bacterium]|nr:tRNA threonylcarbamoyladenosine dehydratase [Prevotellaceae bacterium]